MFERLYLEISNICNLQCDFCPEVIRKKKLMPVESFRQFAKKTQHLTKQICLHLMGEPLGHPEFAQIMDVCDELGLRIFLTTNGTLIRRHSDKLLSWKSLDQINFSVHSYFANAKQRSLEEYLEPILNFCDESIRQEKNHYLNLRLWNLEHTDEQNNQNLRVFNILNERYGCNLNTNVDVKLNKSKHIKHKLYVHFDTEFIWPDPKNAIRSEAGTCYGLRKQLAVHANGDVVPCCLDKESRLKIGNMYENSIEDILKSDRAQNIKRGFESNRLVEDLCRRCQYADRFKEKLKIP